MIRKSSATKAILMLTIICLLLFVGTSPLKTLLVQADNEFDSDGYLPSAGEIILTKTATPVNNTIENREFKVELTMQGISLETTTPADIVLVIDLSQSMESIIEGNLKNKLFAIKSAATDFIMNVLPDGTANRLALVTYSGSPDDGPNNDAWINYSFADWDGHNTFFNKMSLLNTVMTLTTDDGTNMEAGFIKADELLDQSTSNNKIVIFMTDGEPTFYYDENGETVGNGISFDRAAANKALSAANSLRQNHDVTIYTVGLIGEDALAKNVSSVLNPIDNSYNEAYYQASDNEGLRSIYAHLVQSINSIAHDVTLIDQIQPGFQYVENSLQIHGLSDEITLGNFQQTNYINHSVWDEDVPAGEIRWRPGMISGETLSLSYRVVAQNQIYGALPTNHKAWLEFKPSSGNLFYNNNESDNPDRPDSKQIEFERPVVCVSPLACDDFYQIEAGATLVADGNSIIPCLLDNDYAKFHLSSVEGWQTTVVQAKLSDSSLTQLGEIISFNGDGSFKYKSNINATGKEIFTYDLKTTISNNKGDTQDLFSRATITIMVIPAASNNANNPITSEEQIKQTEVILDKNQIHETGENASMAIKITVTILVFTILILLIIKKILSRYSTK